MKIHILSDLHLEHASFQPEAAAAAAADVVVLAGDIHTGVTGIEWAARAFEGKPIVYVAGNHELYGQHWDDTLLQMRIVADRVGVHFLENDEVVIDGVRFLGAALWTDFCLYGHTSQEISMRLYECGLNDCRLISAAGGRLTAAMVLERHQQSRASLQQQIAEPFEERTVVVTHHAPSSRSVAPQYQGDHLTPGFASELPGAMYDRVSLWVHGHMHDSFAYTLKTANGTCRVVCNPRGYPLGREAKRFENPAFDPALTVDV